jgi:hypothetical protein
MPDRRALSFAARPSRTTRGIGFGFWATAQGSARREPYVDLATAAYPRRCSGL